VLATLVSLRPRDAFVPAAAHWLMLARQGDAWDCPHDSAQAIWALASYARAAHEGTADYRFRIMLNGTATATGRYGANNQGQAVSTSTPISRLRRAAPNVLMIDRRAQSTAFGRGPLYYVARMRYFLPATAIVPRSEGISISRRYLDLRGRQIWRAPAGSALQVELTIHTDQTLLYLNVQDPLPVGCEAIDQSLNVSQQGLFRAPAWWSPFAGTQDLTWYLAHSDLHDDRVSLYAYYLPPGTYRYTYLVDATVPGRFGVPPTHVSETFFPEVFGRSAGQTFTVSR
jgi:uncharacterized protein YfaS (alpha-2-macroglobulin family)